MSFNKVILIKEFRTSFRSTWTNKFMFYRIINGWVLIQFVDFIWCIGKTIRCVKQINRNDTWQNQKQKLKIFFYFIQKQTHFQLLCKGTETHLWQYSVIFFCSVIIPQIFIWMQLQLTFKMLLLSVSLVWIWQKSRQKAVCFLFLFSQRIFFLFYSHIKLYGVQVLCVVCTLIVLIWECFGICDNNTRSQLHDN